MDNINVQITVHLLAAILAGGVIGLERSYHGRPAGFRTHTLVCLASSLLMLVTMFQWQWLPAGTSMETVRTDPTRMAQGIMTGIGFLGRALSLRRLVGARLDHFGLDLDDRCHRYFNRYRFYFPAILATVLTLGTLSVFRWFERKLPAHYYAHNQISFARNNVMAEGKNSNSL